MQDDAVAQRLRLIYPPSPHFHFYEYNYPPEVTPPQDALPTDEEQEQEWEELFGGLVCLPVLYPSLIKFY